MSLCVGENKTKTSILTLFYKMTINNDTKKIETPPKEIPCTYYVGSSVCRISVVIRCEFVLVRTREFLPL